MSKSNLTKNTIFLSIGTILNKGLVFLLIPFFSSWLSTEDYGTFDLISTYVTLFIPLIGLSLTEALFRFSLDTKDESLRKKYVSTTFGVFSFNLCIVLIVAFILYFLNIWNLALCCSFLLIGETYMTFFNGYLRSIKKLSFYSFTNIISTIFIAIFTTIFIKFYHMNLEGIILGYGLGYFIGNIITIIYTKFWNEISLSDMSVAVAQKMLRYSYVLIPNSISWWIINVSDRTIINMVLGASFNGIYAIASKVPNFCTSLFSVFNISWQESAIETVDSKERNQYYNSVYNKMFVILISLCCGVLSIQFILFQYIFDVRYLDAHLYTSVLILSTVFSTISIFFGGIQISLKNPKANGISTVVGAISNVLIHVVLIPFIGLYAAALSTLLSQILVCYLRKRLLNKEIGLKLERKNYYYIAVFLYLAVCAYFCDTIGLYINVVNLIFAGILFCFSCKDYIMRILKKGKVIFRG